MADTDHVLAATRRTEFGKGAARRTRRAGNVPAVLYGHGTDPVHLSLPTHETFLALKDNVNALLTLQIDGKDELALAKDIQVHPVHRTLEHIDFILVRRGEKVVVEVPVHLTGESAPGTIHTLDLQNVELKAEATKIPEHIEGSIEGLEEGDVLRVSQLEVPKGVEIETDEEYAVATISIPRGEETPEDEEGDEESEAAAEPAGEE